MPSHWTSAKLNIVTNSSSTGTQFLHAAGLAQAASYLKPASDEIALVCSGEGATSQGEFWECMNIACLEKLPLLALIEDNGYAISVPVERQTAGGNIASLLQGFPGLLRLEVDGTDFWLLIEAMKHAADYCRAGHGPALVRAAVVRPYSHSFSEDESALTNQSRTRRGERCATRWNCFRSFWFAEDFPIAVNWTASCAAWT